MERFRQTPSTIIGIYSYLNIHIHSTEGKELEQTSQPTNYKSWHLFVLPPEVTWHLVTRKGRQQIHPSSPHHQKSQWTMHGLDSPSWTTPLNSQLIPSIALRCIQTRDSLLHPSPRCHNMLQQKCRNSVVVPYNLLH